MYNVLSERRRELFTRFETEGKNEHHNALYDLLDEVVKSEKELQFQIGDYKFLVIATIGLTSRLLLLKTYELIYKVESYPELITEHATNLDVKVDARGVISFKDSDHQGSSHLFIHEYFLRLLDFIKEKEKGMV